MADIIPIDSARAGASPGEWDHFSFILGLTSDLLPVVSNLKATISPESAMKGLGKTPSWYNSNGHAVGIANWTQRQSTMANIEAWAKQKDYGICLQTRNVRAIDVDISDESLAAEIEGFILLHLGVPLPLRSRNNASKFLLAFELPGEFYKRSFKCSFKCKHGIVEFLATGQQFICCGTHTSGARYEWDDGLPSEFPGLSAEQFEALWQALVDQFAIEAPSETMAPSKAKTLADAIHSDPTAQHLYLNNLVLSEAKDGRLDIVCPFAGEHSSESSESATSYYPAHTGGYERGHFHCLHAHCADRSDQEYLGELGLLADEFEDLSAVADMPPAAASVLRFPVLSVADFCNHPPATWLIKSVIPYAELIVLYGESGSGKSFMALDMAMAIATGREWRGKKVRKGKVVYIAAEGAAGFRLRLQAYCQHHGIDIPALPFGVIHASPNLMQKDEAIDIAKAILASGGADLIIVDTFAQVMPGANENAGEDVGLALKHCKGIHRATHAPVLLVHHSGKDQSKGARGWSGLRAAADAEIEVTRDGDARQLRVSKQKDAEDGAEFGFKLVPVILGMDEDGDAISSCIVEEADPIQKASKGRALGKVEKLVVEVVNEIAQCQNAGIEVKHVLDEVVKRMPLVEGKRDTRKQHARRALLSLCTGDDAPYFSENDCLEIM
jgi:hypothetical protein